jgi:hypothetical protein
MNPPLRKTAQCSEPSLFLPRRAAPGYAPSVVPRVVRRASIGARRGPPRRGDRRNDAFRARARAATIGTLT